MPCGKVCLRSVSANKGEDVQNAAIGLDVRSGRYLEGLEEVLDQLKAEGYKFEILFLDADDRTLVKRYKETRRTHPLAMTGRGRTLHRNLPQGTLYLW